MTADGLSALEWLTSNLWLFFTSWYIPGTNTTPAQWLYFILLIIVFVPVVKKFISRLS